MVGMLEITREGKVLGVTGMRAETGRLNPCSYEDGEERRLTRHAFSVLHVPVLQACMSSSFSNQVVPVLFSSSTVASRQNV